MVGAKPITRARQERPARSNAGYLPLSAGQERGHPLASAAPACLNDAIGRPHVPRGARGDGLTGGEDASRAAVGGSPPHPGSGVIPDGPRVGASRRREWSAEGVRVGRTWPRRGAIRARTGTRPAGSADREARSRPSADGFSQPLGGEHRPGSPPRPPRRGARPRAAAARPTSDGSGWTRCRASHARADPAAAARFRTASRGPRAPERRSPADAVPNRFRRWCGGWRAAARVDTVVPELLGPRAWRAALHHRRGPPPARAARPLRSRRPCRAAAPGARARGRPPARAASGSSR
jgi:hypothetical protein